MVNLRTFVLPNYTGYMDIAKVVQAINGFIIGKINKEILRWQN